MAGYHKDKQTGKWYCDECNEEVSKEEVLSGYDYFRTEKNKEHTCRKEV